MTQPITRQEGFNRAWQHFVVEKKPRAATPHNPGSCSYRLITDDGALCCAVGLLIPDDLYRPQFEGLGFDGLTADFPEIRALFTSDWRDEDSRFGENFQEKLHDDLPDDDSALREEYYRLFAHQWGLTIPGEDQP